MFVCKSPLLFLGPIFGTLPGRHNSYYREFSYFVLLLQCYWLWYMHKSTVFSSAEADCTSEEQTAAPVLVELYRLFLFFQVYGLVVSNAQFRSTIWTKKQICVTVDIYKKIYQFQANIYSFSLQLYFLRSMPYFKILLHFLALAMIKISSFQTLSM